MFNQVQANTNHYDRITDAWPFIFGESFHWGLFERGDEELPEATINLIEAMANMCPILSGARVLDIGCGIGGPAIHLAKHRDCTVTGISISSIGINRAREMAARSDVRDQLNFLVGDAMQ